jgi:hypothetical protein
VVNNALVGRRHLRRGELCDEQHERGQHEVQPFETVTRAGGRCEIARRPFGIRMG